MPVSNMFCSVVPSAVFARFGAMLQLEGAEAAALQVGQEAWTCIHVAYT